EQLLDLAMHEIYDESPASAFVRVEYSDGGQDTLHFRDFVSGATLRNIVDRAKKLAVKDQLATGQIGVGAQHLQDAITAEFVENEDMPSAAHPEDWARVSGLPGSGRRRVDAIVPLQGRTRGVPAAEAIAEEVPS
ncbi:MAG: proteasome ATPase, partial [Brachybacterium sp.]